MPTRVAFGLTVGELHTMPRLVRSTNPSRLGIRMFPCRNVVSRSDSKRTRSARPRADRDPHRSLGGQERLRSRGRVELNVRGGEPQAGWGLRGAEPDGADAVGIALEHRTAALARLACRRRDDVIAPVQRIDDERIDRRTRRDRRELADVAVAVVAGDEVVAADRPIQGGAEVPFDRGQDVRRGIAWRRRSPRSRAR